MQQPGTTAGYDGYELRTDPAGRAPTRSSLERVDNGTLVNRLTINAGTRRRRHRAPARHGYDDRGLAHNGGSSWSRLGVVADSTYGAGGLRRQSAMRGTTGRLDDFGARTMGTPARAGSPARLRTCGSRSRNAPGRLSWNAPSFDRRRADHELTPSTAGTTSGILGSALSPDRRHVDERSSDTTASRTAPPTTTTCQRATRYGESLPSERGLRHACEPRRPRRTAAHDRQLRPSEREPALGRRPVVERRHRLGRDRSLHPEQLAGLLEDDDVHGVA